MYKFSAYYNMYIVNVFFFFSILYTVFIFNVRRYWSNFVCYLKTRTIIKKKRKEKSLYKIL